MDRVYIAASVNGVPRPAIHQERAAKRKPESGYSVGMLSALSCAGYAYRVGPGLYLPTDVAERAEHRASVLARQLPVDAIVMLQAAVWLHAGGPFPDLFDVVTAGGRRPESTEHVRLRYLAIPVEDQVRVGPVIATTAIRTAVDLATLLPPAQALPNVHRLREATAFSLDDALTALDRSARPRRARARATLLAFAGADQQPVGGCHDQNAPVVPSNRPIA